jgi:DNA-binding GntR family transcriptional regulator
MAPGLNVQSGISTLADAATAELRERILSGELASGTPLRLEELARSLGMSISPIREAVRKLENLGLAEYVPHRGSRVTLLTVEDLADTYEARLVLEPLAVARAAERITQPEIATAQRALATYMACFERGERAPGRVAHDAFHFALYGASGSEWLVRLSRPAWENSERYRALAMPDLEMIRAREPEHERIHAACAAGDGETAAEELRRHLLQTERFVIEQLEAAARDLAAGVGDLGEPVPDVPEGGVEPA